MLNAKAFDKELQELGDKHIAVQLNERWSLSIGLKVLRCRELGLKSMQESTGKNYITVDLLPNPLPKELIENYYVWGRRLGWKLSFKFGLSDSESFIPFYSERASLVGIDEEPVLC